MSVQVTKLLTTIFTNFYKFYEPYEKHCVAINSLGKLAIGGSERT